MSDAGKTPLYRLFQLGASVAGALLTIGGSAISNQVLWAMGLVILTQGLLGLGIIFFEDRRGGEKPTDSQPQT